ncbi:MAG: glycoside-pentoside-hexuronide (GPH):cation symporter [Clostridiales bacterium]|jgi:sugar (glycoside-pentoside-hexuronide) transporter|nr:glycoside-pentoside-hexuronide (GPH):cation symporter [Clostridiales bacterium]
MTSNGQKLTNNLHKLFGTVPDKGLQPKEAIAYSITGFGQNLICTVIGSYLIMFMTDAIFFDYVFVAYLMLFTRLFDAFNDPIMGSLVDKTRTKYGKCRPFLRWSAIPIAALTLLCFLPVYKNNLPSMIIISLFYVIWSVAYTIADVPYWGLSSSMTNDTEIRGKLLMVARLCCTLGAGLVTVLIPPITSALQKKYTDADGYILTEKAAEAGTSLAWTYFIVALIIVVIAVPMFYYGFKKTKEHIHNDQKAHSLIHNLKLLGKNKPLILIIISGVLGCAKTVYIGVGGLYFAKYALTAVSFLGMQGEALYSIITLAVIPGGLIATLLVPYCTKKFGKKNTYIYSHLVGAAFMFAMYFIGYKSSAGLIFALIGLIILGIPQGFSNVMLYAFIGDSVDYLEWKTGERGEGICFAMQTFINKIGLAAGAFIGVIAYGMSGVNPTDAGGTITDSGLQKLWAMLVLSGAISMLLCAIPIIFYKFDEKTQRAAVAEINARKAEQPVTEAE